MDFATILPILIAGGLSLAGLAWKAFTQNSEIQTGNKKLDAIVKAAQDQAIASDCYMRITADGVLTVNEQEEHRKLAAQANVSLLYAIEQITGQQVYNRVEVPLPLPVGGSREVPEQEPTVEQPAQPVSPPVG
jgi:hypothetical protein